MNTHFTDVGMEYSRGRETAIVSMVESADWMPVTPGMSMPFMQGEALKHFLKNFPHGKVLAWAWGGKDPWEFYLVMVRMRYKQGVVDVAIADDGLSITPVVTITHF